MRIWIPEADGVVKVTPARQRAAIRTPRHARYLIRMPPQDGEVDAVVRIPQPHRAIITRTRQRLTIRTPRNRDDMLRVPPQRAHMPQVVDVTHIPDADGFVTTSTRQQITVRCEGEAQDTVCMPRHLAAPVAIVAIAHPNVMIIPSTIGDEVGVMRGQRNGLERIPDILFPALSAGGDIPSAESAVKTPTDQRPLSLKAIPKAHLVCPVRVSVWTYCCALAVVSAITAVNTSVKVKSVNVFISVSPIRKRSRGTSFPRAM